MTCSRRWEKPDAKYEDRKAIPDGRQIRINATTIINTNGADFDRWDEPSVSYHRRTQEQQTTYRIRVPSRAVILTTEECYIDYHGPSAHNEQQGSVGSVWCKNCLNDGSKRDTTNIIANVDWTPMTRTALTVKLRQLTTTYPAIATTTTRGPARG